MLMPAHAVLNERYTLDAVIGRGGMADVYRAIDSVLEREVAVKVMRTHMATDGERASFVEEARTLAAIEHPNVVSVLDAGLAVDVPYLVMDLVEGQSLAPLCKSGPLPADQVTQIGAVLADVLIYVHARDIVHRDLKPSNILIGADDAVWLADFGIARMSGDTPGGDGTTTGTAAYIAPEQVLGEAVTSASDIYSLGLVLLEALTARRAYTGSPMGAALARLEAAPLIPTSLPTGWPSLLTQMTYMDPTRRPSAEEVARALEAQDVGAPPYLGPPGVPASGG